MALLIAKTNAISNKCTHNVSVWCGFWTGGIIGSYFFENEAGQAATINRARYRDMITILSVEIE